MPLNVWVASGMILLVMYRAVPSKCRFCQAILEHTFVDLGMTPLSTEHVAPGELNRMMPFYPLHAYVCKSCFLVQLDEFVTSVESFHEHDVVAPGDFWHIHAQRYVDKILSKHAINETHLVAEISGYDVTLLPFFVDRKVPVLSVDASVAVSNDQRVISPAIKFFGLEAANELVQKYGKTNLLIANNVLTRASDINDFVSGMKAILAPQGVVTVEFSHLLKLVERNQFDAVCHEHCTYLSLTTVDQLFKYHGLAIFDVDELPYHGGSLRVYAKHREDISKRIEKSVTGMLKVERSAGINKVEFYSRFERNVRVAKAGILEFLIEAKMNNKSIVAFGSAGRGNTLLNYCGIRRDFIDYTVDLNPARQGNFLPGTLIPIVAPDKLRETKPDFILILSWNLKEDIMHSMSFIHEWGGKFVISVPELRVLDSRWLSQDYRRAS